jgi:hypothetical protein
LKTWHPKANTKLFELKDSLLKRELELASYAEKNYKKVLKFSEVNDPNPMAHVKELARQFNEI